MAREYPRTGGGSSPACHRRSDVSRAAELTPWSSARDRSADDLDLVLLPPLDPPPGCGGALDLDFDLLLKVGGEGSREAAEYHEPRDQPCHARPHAYPPSFLVYCVSQIESRRASTSRPVTLALTPILRRTSVQMAHRRRVSTSLPRRC